MAVFRIPSNLQARCRQDTHGRATKQPVGPRPRELYRHGPHRSGPSRGTICALRLRSQHSLLQVVAETCLARILVWFR